MASPILCAISQAGRGRSGTAAPLNEGRGRRPQVKCRVPRDRVLRPRRNLLTGPGGDPQHRHGVVDCAPTWPDR